MIGADEESPIRLAVSNFSRVLAIGTGEATNNREEIGEKMFPMTVLGADLLAEIPRKGGKVEETIADVALALVHVGLGDGDNVARGEKGQDTEAKVITAVEGVAVESVHQRPNKSKKRRERMAKENENGKRGACKQERFRIGSTKTKIRVKFSVISIQRLACLGVGCGLDIAGLGLFVCFLQYFG